MLSALGHVSRMVGLHDLLPNAPDGTRTVIDVYGAAGPVMSKAVGFDVAVTHPCAPSYIVGSSTRQRYAAEAREAIKLAKYDAACESVGITFVPAVFESFGVAGKLFEEWFKDTMKAKDKADKAAGVRVSWTAHTTSAFWQQRISVALQVGNARMIHRCGARDSTVDGFRFSYGA
jgi:hypothetical protein